MWTARRKSGICPIGAATEGLAGPGLRWLGKWFECLDTGIDVLTAALAWVLVSLGNGGVGSSKAAIVRQRPFSFTNTSNEVFRT